MISDQIKCYDHDFWYLVSICGLSFRQARRKLKAIYPEIVYSPSKDEYTISGKKYGVAKDMEV